jgi:hypothetical protein
MMSATDDEQDAARHAEQEAQPLVDPAERRALDRAREDRREDRDEDERDREDAAKAAITESSQLSPRKSDRIGISWTSGVAIGAKYQAATAAPIQPRIDSVSRTKPRE